MNLVSCVIQKDDISHIDELNIKFVVVHDRGMALRSHHRYNKEPTQAKNSRTVSDSEPDGPERDAFVRLSNGRHRRVRGFAVRVHVEALFFGFVRDADAVGDLIGDLKARPRGASGVDRGGDRRDDLDDGLFHHRDFVEASERRRREDAEQNGTQETTDAVHAEDIKRIIVTKLLLDGGGEEALSLIHI